jgi:LAO/AO transport system kinase
MGDDLYGSFTAGDPLAAARLMSTVERGGEAAEAVLERVFPRVGRARRVGLTGSTGAGKSSIASGLIHAYRGAGHTVGVVAEDPSSPFTGGAVLGDRIRMRRAQGDAGVFVRSIASRGTESGLSALALELADILDAFGRDLILLETTGVGQLEHRIRYAADTTVVVFTPESFVVNKADRPLADRFAADLADTLGVRGPRDGWTPPVLSTVASREEGIDTLVGAIDAHAAHLGADGRLSARRRAGLAERVRAVATERLAAVFWGSPTTEREFNAIFEAVAAGRLSPCAAARRLVESHRGA